MIRKTSLTLLACLAGCLMLNGCVSVNVGKDEETTKESKPAGLFEAFCDLDGIHSYNGTFIEAGILSTRDRWGNIVSLEVWPIAGLGVSFIGLKAQLLPLQAGVGFFGYDPRCDPSVAKVSKTKHKKTIIIEEEK